jgi:copper homeostasis protein
MEVEICVDSLESAIAAARGEAHRIELCSALSEGGITPSFGLIQAVRDAIDIDVYVIIRPRGGDFVYSEHELRVMSNDILEAKALGVNGVVLGLLTPEETVDVARTRALVQLARPLSVTFHRAFDTCEDLDSALEDVIACGADRLLTSGGRFDASRGCRQIARLREAAGKRIQIMAGGGVRPSNVRQLVQRTGVVAVHTSLNARADAGERESVRFTNTSKTDAAAPFTIHEEDVRAFKAALDGISAKV